MKKAVLTAFIAVLIGASTLVSTAWAGGYGHRGHYSYGYSGHHRGGGDELVAGLIIGGLFGWFLNEDRHYDRARYSRPYYETRYYASDYPVHTYYRGPTYRTYSTAPRYHSHAPAPSRTRVTSGEFDQCVMTREYTTVINIDGVDTPAYGTRCMQADGSWQLGAPKLVPAN